MAAAATRAAWTDYTGARVQPPGDGLLAPAGRGDGDGGGGLAGAAGGAAGGEVRMRWGVVLVGRVFS